MRFGLQKGGRWLAGRLQGSKGVQKYDQYMEENPWASKALTVGDIAAATLGGAALLGGGSVGTGLARAGSGVKGLLTGAGKGAGAAAKGVGKGAVEAGKFAKTNKDLLTMAGKGAQQFLPNEASEAAMMNAETQRMRLEEEQRQAALEEERKRKIAELLMPYAADMTGFFGMNRNR